MVAAEPAEPMDQLAITTSDVDYLVGYIKKQIEKDNVSFGSATVAIAVNNCDGVEEAAADRRSSKGYQYRTGRHCGIQLPADCVDKLEPEKPVVTTKYHRSRGPIRVCWWREPRPAFSYSHASVPRFTPKKNRKCQPVFSGMLRAMLLIWKMKH